MIFEESLLKALEDRGTVPLSQIVWRVTISGQPPLRPNVRGARWNPADTAALYTSLDDVTARAEWEYLVDMQPVRPRGDLVVSRIDVRLKSVVDLADTEILRRQFGLELASLPEDVSGYLSCQQIGGAAAFLGRSAVLVPSLRHTKAVNLVIFTTNVTTDEGSYELA
jgi:RES domain-containing protein